LVWDLANGKLLQTLLGHDPHQRIHTVSFNRNGRLLCSGSTDQTVRVWNIDESDGEKTPSKTFYTKQTSIYFSEWLEKDVVVAAGVFKK
jgi:WD40 repeat protein